MIKDDIFCADGKKRLSRKSKLEKYFKELEVDLNGGDVSDIIENWPEKERFVNLRTGKCSDSIENVIDGKPYIVISGRWTRKPVYGYYTFMDKENDLFCVIFAELEEDKWVEKSRLFISWSVYPYATNKDVLKNATKGIYDIYDICGQAYYDKKTNDFKNFPGQSQKSAMDYFGLIKSLKTYYKTEPDADVMLSVDENQFCYFLNFYNLFCQLTKKEDPSVLCFSENGFFVKIKSRTYVQRYDKPCVPCLGNMDDFLEMDIPKEAKGNIMKLVRIMQKGVADSKVHFCLVEKAGDKAIIRRFVLIQEATSKGLKINYRELDRILFNQYAAASITAYRYDILVYVGNIKGTDIEHFDTFLQGMVEVYSKSKKADSFNSLIVDISNRYLRDYKINYYNAINITKNICGDHWTESILKVYGSNEGFLNELLNYLTIYNNGRSVMRTMFDGVNEKAKTLNEFLEMPKNFMEICLKYSDYKMATKIKRIFRQCKDGLSYFMRINKTDLEFMVKILLLGGDKSTRKITCFDYMVYIWGYENWKGFLKYLNTLSLDSLKQYLDLLDVAYNLTLWDKTVWTEENCRALHEILESKETGGDCNNIASAMEWKIKPEYIQKTTAAMKMILNSDVEEIPEMAGKYKKFYDRWEKDYTFACDNLQIVFPKNPADLAYEGIKLHHCVLDFHDAVGNGATTILFIRKQDSLDEPFFTLEVENSKIRQCHGYANSTVKKGSPLDHFLHAFCKEKNIQYSIGSELLGV